jgi:hypothetical protein
VTIRFTSSGEMLMVVRWQAYDMPLHEVKNVIIRCYDLLGAWSAWCNHVILRVLTRKTSLSNKSTKKGSRSLRYFGR